MTLTMAALPGGATDQEPDGYTARITFPGSAGDAVLVPDENGDFTAEVTIWEEFKGDWESIEMRATLRVFEDTGPFEVTDRVSIPFTSQQGPMEIKFPGDSFEGGTLDVFVTFSELGGDPVPTSHHHLVKNLAIQMDDFETADSYDHHSTRVVALPA